MERQSKGLTLADGMLADLGGPRTAGLLERLEAATPWAQLAAVVKPLYRNTSAKGGRPNVPVVVMLKVTLMQRWFGLSDPAMEEAIVDRLSFRRFLGLIVSEGTAVDATIIEAPTGGPRKPDGLTSSKDKAATHTKKHGRIYHGYKAHVASDANAMITDYRLDTAKVHDINHFEALTEDEHDAVFADSAYRYTKRREQLEQRGVFYGVMHRRVRGQPQLTHEQKHHNRLCASVRGICVRPFAWLRRAGRKRTRYRGLRKTGTDFGLWATSYNLWRSLSVRPA